MLRRYLAPYNADRTPASTFNQMLLARDFSEPVVRRSWTIDVLDRLAGRHRQVSRLRAAVQTDMVGYSRLFGLDNHGTIVR